MPKPLPRSVEASLEKLEELHIDLTENSDYVDIAVLDDIVRQLEVLSSAADDNAHAYDCEVCGFSPCECDEEEDEDE